MAKGHDKDLKEGEAGVQVVGYLGRLVGAPRVLPWAPADEAVVDARPPLPEAALRGGRLDDRAAGFCQTDTASSRGAR